MPSVEPVTKMISSFMRDVDKLPVLPTPLREPDPDAPLDLGACVATLYEDGRYDLLIDYRRPPPPPALSEVETRWLDEWLRARSLR